MRNRIDIDDLNYLAGLGYEKNSVSQEDIDLLKRNIRKRSRVSSGNQFFAFVCIITGAFLGINVVWITFNHPDFPIAYRTDANSPKRAYSFTIEKVLDTVEIKNENFIKSPVKRYKDTRRAEVFSELPEKLEPTIISNLNESGTPKSEKDLLYIPNSPVLFIHDLKVSDYHKLYFRESRYVLLHDNKSLTAAMSSSVANKSALPQAVPGVYLHEILSDALLAFKNQDYARSQFLLAELLNYNSSDINALFYSGMCNYRRKNYIEAIEKLEECLSHPNNAFHNEARYYKALSMSETGDKSGAEMIMKQIKEENGFYSEKAKQFLER